MAKTKYINYWRVRNGFVMYSVQINFTGRKSKTGSICFDSGHLGVFVDYCGNCHSKIVMDMDEAERFANKLADEKHRPSNKRLLKEIKKRRF